MMLGLHPFDAYEPRQSFFSPRRQPAHSASLGSLGARRTAAHSPSTGSLGGRHNHKDSSGSSSSSAATEPSELKLHELNREYQVRLEAPGCSLDNLHPTVDAGKVLVVSGEQPSRVAIEYGVDWHRGVRVRAEPHLRSSVLGYLEYGDRFLGSPPVDGWVQLTDEAGWVLLDGSSLGLPTLLKPLRRTPTRAMPFVRKLRLPADADIDAAAARHHGHTLTITMPKLARKKPAAPPPATVPTTAKRPAAPTAPPAATSAAPAARRSKSPPPPTAKPARAEPPASARAAPQARPMEVDTPAAAPRRPASARPAVPLVPGLSSADPLLLEAAPSAANVQSPAERCEEWRAMACGGFAPASAPLQQSEVPRKAARRSTANDDFCMV